MGAEQWYSAPEAAVNDGDNVSTNEWSLALLPIVIDEFLSMADCSTRPPLGVSHRSMPSGRCMGGVR